MKKLYILILIALSIGFGQESSEKKEAKHSFIFEPDSLFLNIGETGTVTIKLVDADGNLANNPFYVYGRPRRGIKTKDK